MHISNHSQVSQLQLRSVASHHHAIAMPFTQRWFGISHVILSHRSRRWRSRIWVAFRPYPKEVCHSHVRGPFCCCFRTPTTTITEIEGFVCHKILLKICLIRCMHGTFIHLPYMDPMGMSENENCSKPPLQRVVFQEFPLPFGTICHREVVSSFTKLIIYSSQSPVPGVSC